MTEQLLELRPQTVADHKCCAPSGCHTDHSKATTNTKNWFSFAVDDAGAYQYVCQVLFGKCPTQHNDFYVLLEENGLQDDILGICIIPDAYLYLMTFFDHATGTTKSIIESDVTLLQFWKVYNAHCYHIGQPIMTAQDMLSINPAEYDSLFQEFVSGLPLGTTCTQHAQSYIPPISVHSLSTTLQSLSNESLPGNGENADSNLPVKTHATANNVPNLTVKTHATAINVPITESVLNNGENAIPASVPTQTNEKEDCPKACDHINNVNTTSIHSAESIKTINCASEEPYDQELLEDSVPLDWNIDLDYQVLDWSFDLWGETTIPSSSLLKDDQALLSESKEELVTFYDIEDNLIINSLHDIDGTTVAIPGSSSDVLGISNVDSNSSVSVGTKVTTYLTEPCEMYNCTDKGSVFRTILHAADNQLHHTVDGIFEVVPKDPPVQEPPPEPPPAEPPPHEGTHVWTQSLANETTIIMNGEIAILLVAE